MSQVCVLMRVCVQISAFFFPVSGLAPYLRWARMLVGRKLGSGREPGVCVDEGLCRN